MTTSNRETIKQRVDKMKTITINKMAKVETTDTEDLARGIVAFQLVEFAIDFSVAKSPLPTILRLCKTAVSTLSADADISKTAIK